MIVTDDDILALTSTSAEIQNFLTKKKAILTTNIYLHLVILCFGDCFVMWFLFGHVTLIMMQQRIVESLTVAQKHCQWCGYFFSRCRKDSEICILSVSIG